MRSALAAAALGLALACPGAHPLPDHATAFSRSGQFVVSGPRAASPGPVDTRQPGETLLRLTPQTLAPSCEKVKAEVLRSLDLPDRWRADGADTGKIFLGIDPLVRTNLPLAVQAVPFEHGWRFHVALPTTVEEDRLVRVLTQAIVMEIANRRGNQRAGEPPLWLIEGLTQSILANSPGGVIFQPQSRTISELRLNERLNQVRAQLARSEPLPFHELSQPDLTRLDAAQWRRFSACSHLLLHELSRLPRGPSRLAHWILHLQDHWNWQSGFLESFQPTFRSLLDVEKWWALVLADFTGRDARQTWPAEFALRKLDEALQPVGILPGAASRPSRLRLEEIITDWDLARQIPVLRRFLQQARAISIQAPSEIRSLTLRYADTVADYLERRSKTGSAPVGRGQPVPTVRLIVRETAARLRDLDGQRAALAARGAEDSTDTPVDAAAADPQP